MSLDGGYPLYDGTPPHVGCDTSLAAAEQARWTASRRRLRVLRHIEACGAQGATDDEVELALGFPHQSASARRRELVLLGLVRDSGRRRATRHRRAARVWILGLGDISPGGGVPALASMPAAAELRRAAVVLRDSKGHDAVCAWLHALADTLDAGGIGGDDEHDYSLWGDPGEGEEPRHTEEEG